MESELARKIDGILARDERYRLEAYRFVLAALTYTIQRSGRSGHVSAAELLGGIRDFGLEQFGPLTKTVFNYWGVEHSAQFGDIVFNLIEAGLLGRRREDRREDFDAAAFDLDRELRDHGG